MTKTQWLLLAATMLKTLSAAGVQGDAFRTEPASERTQA